MTAVAVEVFLKLANKLAKRAYSAAGLSQTEETVIAVLAVLLNREGLEVELDSFVDAYDLCVIVSCQLLVKKQSEETYCWQQLLHDRETRRSCPGRKRCPERSPRPSQCTRLRGPLER